MPLDDDQRRTVLARNDNYLAVCITDSHNQCMLLECIYIIPQEALSNKNYPKAISKSTLCGNGETTYQATSGFTKNWAT